MTSCSIKDLILRRGEISLFSRGLLGSVVTAMARLYFFVADEGTTERFGPVTLHKGQMENVRFNQPLRSGCHLALFARGADVSCSAFGDLGRFVPDALDCRQ